MIELFFGEQDKVWPQSPHEEMKLMMKVTVCMYGWLSRFVKRLGVFLLPLDAMLVHRRVPPQATFPLPIYTLGWRETVQK